MIEYIKEQTYELNNIYELELLFNYAKEFKTTVFVLIEMPELEVPEMIVNSYENIDFKLKYYKEKYNEDLTMKVANAIKIKSGGIL